MAKRGRPRKKPIVEEPTSPYPTLVAPITTLKELAEKAEGERLRVLEKWVERLHVIELEIRKLERIERMTENLSKVHKNDNKDT